MPRPVPFPDAQPGQPPDLFFVQQWGGIDTHSSRPAIEDNEFSWLQNYIPLGSGNLRTAWSNATPVFTSTGPSIIYVYFFNIATVQQCAVFFDDGTAIQVNPVSGATVPISATPNFFYNGSAIPAAAQWNASGIVIATEASNPNGYFAWDGTTLFRPGDPAPSWLTNQVPTVMPSGIHGNAIETYQNRAWVTTPPEPGSIPSIISQSAPGNGANFSPPSGGGSTPQQDSSLRASFIALKQINGFLYAFGDSSIAVISNVQQTGGVATYSNQNVDPQIGTIWPGTVQVFSGTDVGAAIFFANPQGVFVLVGGYCKKVSDDLDNLFFNADTATFTPTASVAIVFGIKVYCLLLKTLDRFGQPITVMAMTAGQAKQAGQLRWFLATQDLPQKLIATNEHNSILETWASSGLALYKCFAQPSATLPKTLQSKLFAGRSNAEWLLFKKLYRFYLMLNDNQGTGAAFTGSYDSESLGTTFNLAAQSAAFIIWQNNSNQTIQFVNNSSQAINFTVVALLLPMVDATCYGRLLGVTLNSMGADYTLVSLAMLYSLDAPYGG